MKQGLYAVELGATRTQRTDAGLILPCARIDPLPATAADVHFASLSASPLLLPGTHPAFLRVTADASVLLTIYKVAGPTPPPELRIRLIGAASGEDQPGEAALPSLPLALTIHVEQYGDLLAGGGLWAAAPNGQSAIEGFAMTLLESGLPPDALEYQAVLGLDWASPWTTAGEFCGSRGLALPLLGVRIRLRTPHDSTHAVTVWGRFAESGERGPFEDGTVCEADKEALVGLRVTVGERPQKQPALAGAPSSGRARRGKP